MVSETEKEEKERLARELACITLPGPSDSFCLVRVSFFWNPHPYCITPKHLQFCDSMYLNSETIARAEGKGAKCGFKGCTKKQTDHVKTKVLMVGVPKQYFNDLNNCPGLLDYLKKIKAELDDFSITTVGFEVLKHE